MKRAYLYAMLLSIPLLILLVALQAGRFDVLANQARRLEDAQESWVQENRKLEAGIYILSSRERAEASAESLGLKKAGPERSLRVIVRPDAQQQRPQQPAKAGGGSRE